MSIGIICEYNPMHLGHLYQINKIKEKYPDAIIVIVTCGCFTQRGDICVINKWNKTRCALDNGVDLIIELPFVYACQSADIFANGALKILSIMNVDMIVFGSECNDINKLENVVNTQLYNDNYNSLVKNYLDKGISYPSSMSKAIFEILGYTIKEPNDLLGISYIKEIKRNNYNIKYCSIKRTNNYHSDDASSNIVNASLIRKKFLDGEDISKYIVDNSFNYLYKNISLDKCFNYLKYHILVDDISNIQTVDEGIDNRLKKIVVDCDNLEDLIFKVKSKRYTYNKIQRMLLHILINFKKEEASNLDIDYIRVLGFSINGKNYLNKIKKSINIPVITSYKKNISKVLDIEFRANCIYSLIINDKSIISDEYSHKPVIKDN